MVPEVCQLADAERSPMPAIQYENRGLLGDHLLKVPYFTASIEKLEIWGNVSHPRNARTISWSVVFHGGILDAITHSN